MLFGRNVDRRGVAEADPTWLKARGDELFANRDFASAFQAYSAALEVDGGWVACLANRAACALKLGDFDLCVDDCDAALGALDEGTEHMRPKVLARKAASRCGAGDFQGAAADFDAAAAAAPLDGGGGAQLAADAARARSLAAAATAKALGDAALAEDDAETAVASYTAALAKEPVFVSALANRAAAFLALDDAEAAVDDCSAALRVFELADESSAAGPLPPQGSQKRRAWVLRTLARRGAAHAHLGNIAEAIVDYEAATLIAPDDASLQADLGALRQSDAPADEKTADDDDNLP